MADSEYKIEEFNYTTNEVTLSVKFDSADEALRAYRLLAEEHDSAHYVPAELGRVTHHSITAGAFTLSITKL